MGERFRRSTILGHFSRLRLTAAWCVTRGMDAIDEEEQVGCVDDTVTVRVAPAESCGRTSSEEIVRRCTSSARDLAARERFASLAMPLIGAGTGGVQEELVLRAIEEEVAAHPYDGRVVVVRFVATQS